MSREDEEAKEAGERRERKRKKGEEKVSAIDESVNYILRSLVILSFYNFDQ